MSKNIKKIKIEKVFIKDSEDKEIISTKEKTKGNKYYVCSASIKVSDDCPNYAGEWIKVGFFAYTDPKDKSKNKSGFSKAEYFKSQMEGKEILLDVTEGETYTSKEGVEKVSLSGKLLSKKEAEIAEQFIK